MLQEDRMITTKDLFTTILGNILEWCDFGLFIFLAPILGEKFFPPSDAHTSTLAAFTVFAAGFICRPLGGIIFGNLGDKKGRAQTLRRSILIISFATFLTGLLPSYQTLGITTTILFIALRLIQGISAGGEYTGIMIYLAESASESKQGLLTSLAASGATLGFLLANLIILLLKNFSFQFHANNWNWRLAFILIGALGFIILYYRLKLPETKVFLSLKSSHNIIQKPLLSAIQNAYKSLLKIVGLTCMSSTFYFVFFIYMPVYLVKYSSFSINTSIVIQTLLLITMLFLLPIGGIVGDKFGRRNILALVAVSIFIFVLPCFYVLQQGNIMLTIICLLIATILSSLDQGSNIMAFVENCPINIRYSGIAFAYNLGNAIFGGTTPLMLSLLTERINKFAPAFYLMMVAGVSLITVTTLIAKNKQPILGIKNHQPYSTS